MSQHSVNPAKTPRTCKFSARLFEFSLQDANTFFNEKKEEILLNLLQINSWFIAKNLEVFLILIAISITLSSY